MFLSCGDCLFDIFAGPQEGGDVASVSLSGRVGGSPLNVALGLARLGHRAAFLTKMSKDLFGQRIVAFMDRESIDRRFLVETTRSTTLAMVSLKADGSPRYDFYIEGTADRSIEIADLPASLPEEVRGIHFSSYSTVTEPTASSLQHLIERESGKRLISYDLNVRLAVVPDLDIWRDRVKRIVPLAGLVKASEEDLEALFPGVPVEDILADWIAQGAELAIVTRGERGAVALTRAGTKAEAPGRLIQVVDTVGAGDTFQAAFLAGLAEADRLRDLGSLGGDELEGLLGFAVGAAAVTCTRQGADLPRRADLGLSPLAR